VNTRDTGLSSLLDASHLVQRASGDGAIPIDPPALDPPRPRIPVPLRLVAPSAASAGWRHFLFLQGMPGGFFRLLGAELAQRCARVSRINFNGGDWADWHG